MLYNKKGFTLIETLITVGIAGAASTAVISTQIEDNKKDDALNFIQESKSVLYAVDRRIAIDGYQISNWSKTNWINKNEVTQHLIKKELTSSKLDNCSGGEWNPLIVSEEKAQIIECNLWDKKKSNGIDISATLTPDTLGFINSFKMTLSFEDEDAFSKHFKYIKNGLRKLEGNDSKEITGMHTFELISKHSKSIVSTSECILLADNCQIELTMERAGGSEYIRSDGQNSFINTHVTFVETKGDSPLKCIRWKNTKDDGTGVWSKKTSDLDSCGVGIYRETGHPSVVDIIGKSGTFENVLLDNECNLFKKDGFGVKADGTSPCGMLNKSEIVQVVDNIHAKKALIDEGTFNLTETKSLVSDNISSKTLHVKELANFFEVKTTGNLTVGGLTTITGDLTTKSNLVVNGSSTVTENSTFKKNLTIKGSAFVDNGIVVNGNSNINGILNVSGKVKSNNGDFNNINSQFSSNNRVNTSQNSEISSLKRKLNSLNTTVTGISSGSTGDKNYCNRLGALSLSSVNGCIGYKQDGNKVTYTETYYYWNGTLNQCMLNKRTWTTGRCWREHK